ncbi:UNVERIFIED_CONTAM: hypothetical protein RMT77_016135 [Armadillidium vulgare]
MTEKNVINDDESKVNMDRLIELDEPCQPDNIAASTPERQIDEPRSESLRDFQPVDRRTFLQMQDMVGQSLKYTQEVDQRLSKQNTIILEMLSARLDPVYTAALPPPSPERSVRPKEKKPSVAVACEVDGETQPPPSLPMYITPQQPRNMNPAGKPRISTRPMMDEPNYDNNKG